MSGHSPCFAFKHGTFGTCLTVRLCVIMCTSFYEVLKALFAAYLACWISSRSCVLTLVFVWQGGLFQTGTVHVGHSSLGSNSLLCTQHIDPLLQNCSRLPQSANLALAVPGTFPLWCIVWDDFSPFPKHAPAGLPLRSEDPPIFWNSGRAAAVGRHVTRKR